ncbi:MAG: hypothetical protein ACLT0Y_02525 [Christensenellales bacterium]
MAKQWSQSRYTKQDRFSPYAPYGRRKRRGVKRKPLRLGGKPIVWETTKHSALRTKFLWESRAGRLIDSLQKKGKQTTQKSETRALYALENTIKTGHSARNSASSISLTSEKKLL